MELSYSSALQDALARLSDVLAAIDLPEELASPPRDSASASASPLDEASREAVSSALGWVAAFRLIGAYALPLPDLLSRTGLSSLPGAAGAVAIGSADARAPWNPEDPPATRVEAGQVKGTLSVAPFCAPWSAVRFLASAGGQTLLLEQKGGVTRPDGEGFRIGIDGPVGRVLAEGPEAIAEWQRLLTWERLILVGLTMGVIDRSWRLAIDALCAGRKRDDPLAGEQVAQFQMADNDIERLAMERLGLDAAIDASNGVPGIAEKLALVRYATSAAAERCAQRAHHLADLFLPEAIPVTRWLTTRAHHLSVFGLAREHAVLIAAAGLAAGLKLD